MTRALVIAGNGEHARVVAEAAAASGWELVGWIGPVSNVAGVWLPWLGADADYAAGLADTDPVDRPQVVLGVGGPMPARRAIAARLDPVATWATVVHPAAWVSPSARLGNGTVVLAGAVVNTGASTGAHAIVNSGAVVEHDVRLGDHAHVGPGAAIGGGTVIGDGTFIGLNAAVRDHVTVGDRVIVAMGAAVTQDIESGVTVRGVPARA